jgi:hypothetical protein
VVILGVDRLSGPDDEGLRKGAQDGFFLLEVTCVVMVQHSLSMAKDINYVGFSFTMFEILKTLYFLAGTS